MNELKQSLENIYEKYATKCVEQTSKRLAQIPEININDSRYLEILYYLEEPTFSQFAKEAAISKPSATQIIKRFVDSGYVKKIQSEDDKRVYYLRLEKDFVLYFDEISQIEETLFEKIISVLTKSELTSLTKILNKIDKNM